MTDLYQHIARTIRELRMSYRGEGLSQEALAEKINTSANTVSRWETATYKPSAQELDRLARFFNVPITAFFPGMETEITKDVKAQALLSALGDLDEDELEEVKRYAQFRKAYRALEREKGTKRRAK